MKLPKIYSHFYEGQVFTIDEASQKLNSSGNTLRKRMSDLTTRGYITPIRQGLYRLSKLNETRITKGINSPYEIVSKLTSTSCIGYSSALYYHAKQEIPLNRPVYVISESKFNSFKFSTREFIWCQSRESYGIETKLIEGDGYTYSLNVTDLEKTILDCLKRPAHCKNLEILLTLCNKFLFKPDIDKLMIYTEKMNIRSVYNRLGYLFENNFNSWEITQDHMKYLENNMSKKQINWSIQTNSRHINKWKINFTPQDYH